MFTFLPGPFLVQFSGPFYLSSDSNFSNQKEQIEKEITNIVNKELNSARLSDHAILWLKLGDLNIYDDGRDMVFNEI